MLCKLLEEPYSSNLVKPLENAEFIGGLQQMVGPTKEGPWLVELYTIPSSYKTDDRGRLAYRLFDFDFKPHNESPLVMTGRDYGCSPMHAFDSPGSFIDLLGFLSLEEQDTDDEHFRRYSVPQREWRDMRANDLKMWQIELEDMQNSIWNDEEPEWACTKWDDSDHPGWINCPNCQDHFDRHNFKNRPYSPIHILVASQDGRKVHYHGMFRFPDDVYDCQAKEEVGKALLEAQELDPDNWSYEYVLKRLTEKGYTWIPLAVYEGPAT